MAVSLHKGSVWLALDELMVKQTLAVSLASAEVGNANTIATINISPPRIAPKANNIRLSIVGLSIGEVGVGWV